MLTERQFILLSQLEKQRPRQQRTQTSAHVDIRRRFAIGLGVFDFETPDNRMRLRSVHPGVSVDEVVENTGFELVIEGDVPESRAPSDEELRLIREEIDPEGWANREVK